MRCVEGSKPASVNGWLAVCCILLTGSFATSRRPPPAMRPQCAQISKTRLMLGTLLGRVWDESEVLVPVEQIGAEKLAR